MIIDGKEINKKIKEELAKSFSVFRNKINFGIVIIGEDKASLSFVNVKKKFGEELKVNVNVLNIHEKEFSELIIKKIKDKILNFQKANDAIIIQLPLPDNLKKYTEELINLIEDKKDIDALKIGNNSFNSPIVIAFEKVLNEIKINKEDNLIAIVGIGKVVGIPIREYCIQNNLNFVEVKEGELEKLKNKKIKIIVSAVGKPRFIKAEMIEKGVHLIDYGCSYLNNKLCGDFDPSCYKKSISYTPVPGGMGPVVVACLFLNLLKSLN